MHYILHAMHFMRFLIREPRIARHFSSDDVSFWATFSLIFFLYVTKPELISCLINMRLILSSLWNTEISLSAAEPDGSSPQSSMSAWTCCILSFRIITSETLIWKCLLIEREISAVLWKRSMDAVIYLETCCGTWDFGHARWGADTGRWFECLNEFPFTVSYLRNHALCALEYVTVKWNVHRQPLSAARQVVILLFWRDLSTAFDGLLLVAYWWCFERLLPLVLESWWKRWIMVPFSCMASNEKCLVEWALLALYLQQVMKILEIELSEMGNQI